LFGALCAPILPDWQKLVAAMILCGSAPLRESFFPAPRRLRVKTKKPPDCSGGFRVLDARA